jgi:glycosyltransferase involved in cell wall biosynthesis
LSEALALLNTSHHEGFSNTFLEAFSTGTPVISPEKVDPDHIIRKHALGASVDDVSDFPSVIRQLSENQDRFEETSQRCREYVYKNHDPQLLARRLVEILSKIGRH